MKTVIHIGLHKTGSTFLQEEYFSNSCFNKIDYSSVVEKIVYPHCFDFDLNEAKMFFEKLKNEKTLVITSERLCGNPKSGGYDQKIIADRLHALFPSARILIVIRNQIDAIYSNYKQYLKEGGTIPLNRYLKEIQPEWWPEFRKDYFKYSKLIKYYIEIFGYENIKVMLYEELKSNQTKFLNDLKQFIGEINDISKTSNKLMNPSYSDLSLSIKRIINPLIYGQWHGNKHIVPIFNSKIINKLLFFADRHLGFKHLSFYKKKIKKEFANYFIKDNLKISKISNVEFDDLKKFKYL